VRPLQPGCKLAGVFFDAELPDDEGTPEEDNLRALSMTPTTRFMGRAVSDF
jgi:hypothetical protein